MDSVKILKNYLRDKYGAARQTKSGEIHYRKSADKYPGNGTGWLYYCDIREAEKHCYQLGIIL